jgi:methyl-accepting chemotaxis protein
MNIALIGGGQASLILLDYFASSETINVIGIADLRPDAPGIRRAGKLGISVTTDMSKLIASPKVELVVELTGVPKVAQMVQEMLRPNQDIMSANAARLMCELIDGMSQRNASAANEVSEQFESLNEQIVSAVGLIDTSQKKVGRILRETHVITTNAIIEAARAGDAGDAFSLVARRMQEMLDGIRNALEDIDRAADQSRQTVSELDAAEHNLRTIFGTDQKAA